MPNLDHRLRILLSNAISKTEQFEEAVASAAGEESAAVPRRGRRDRFVDFLARCETRTAVKKLEDAGAEILSVIPGQTQVVIGRAAIKHFEELSSVKGVLRVEMARPIESDLDLSRQDAGVETLHVPTQAGDLPIRGEGVVVGIIDSGIDYQHPKFRNSDGTSRILFLWDQRDTGAGGNPVDLGRQVLDGREYTKAHIDAALASGTPLTTVPHRDINGHGTHVAGIAAGNGRSGINFRGVAPDADLIVVASRSGAATLGKSTNSLLAYQYIIERAGTQPVVINQSQGMNGGGHFGETVLETGIDNLLRDPGVVGVKSAGNEQQWRIHAGGVLALNNSDNIEFRVPQNVTAPVFIEIWCSDENTLGVTVKPPGESALTEVLADSDTAAPIVEQTTASNSVLTVVDRNVDDTGATQITLALAGGSASFVRPGTWQLQLRGEVIDDGRYDIWIERARRKSPVQQARFTVASSENNRNISIPGTARRIITVGSYATRPIATNVSPGNISDFSSRGPTRLGSGKPEITAPGEGIISTRSSHSNRPQIPDSLHTRESGTSMAAPHVAGIAALILGEHPNLTADQVKQILTRSARVDNNSASAPDNTWGDGKVDAAAAIALAESIEFPEIVRFQIRNGVMSLTTDVLTTVTVSHSRSKRQLLLGKSEGTKSNLTLSLNHSLNFRDLVRGTHHCEIQIFSADAVWTLDDNDGDAFQVVV